jgi:hypothetical protein
LFDEEDFEEGEKHPLLSSFISLPYKLIPYKLIASSTTSSIRSIFSFSREVSKIDKQSLQSNATKFQTHRLEMKPTDFDSHNSDYISGLSSSPSTQPLYLAPTLETFPTLSFGNDLFSNRISASSGIHRAIAILDAALIIVQESSNTVSASSSESALPVDDLALHQDSKRHRRHGRQTQNHEESKKPRQ